MSTSAKDWDGDTKGITWKQEVSLEVMKLTQVRNHELLGFKRSAESVELLQRDQWQKSGNDLITASKGWGGFEGKAKASSWNDTKGHCHLREKVSKERTSCGDRQ